eukprot:m.64045 g.64045  ORF g.64045 m.64045 type:complete len:103 (+) comp13474_c2_seq3:1312-1620(+)
MRATPFLNASTTPSSSACLWPPFSSCTLTQLVKVLFCVWIHASPWDRKPVLPCARSAAAVATALLMEDMINLCLLLCLLDLCVSASASDILHACVQRNDETG